MKRPEATECIKEDLSQRVNKKITGSKTNICGILQAINYLAKHFFFNFIPDKINVFAHERLVFCFTLVCVCVLCMRCDHWCDTKLLKGRKKN
jgi:hypothetical protein